MYSEQDAKQRWCPMAQVGRGPNRLLPGEDNDRLRCIGSGCMAWRWSPSKEPLPLHEVTGRAVGLKMALQPTVYETGYCGAFGAPSGIPEVAAA